MAEPYMTMDEIEAKHLNEWVFIDKPTSRGKSLAVTGGFVIFHCAAHSDIMALIEQWDDGGSKLQAIMYTGKFPADELVLAELEPQVVGQ